MARLLQFGTIAIAPCVVVLMTIATLAALVTIPLAPSALKESTLIVLNKQEDTVSLIGLDSGKERARLKTGPNPNEVAVSPSQRVAAISDMGPGPTRPGTTMTFVDVESGKVTRTVDLLPHGMPHGLVWLNDRRIAFTSHSTDSLVELDVESGKVVRAIPTEQKGTHLVVFSPDQKRAFTVNAFSGSVTAIDFVAGKILKQIPTGSRAEGISISPDGTLVACGNVGGNDVSIIDTKKLEVVHTIPNVVAPIRTIFAADGKHLAVSCLGTGALEVFDTKGWKPRASVDLSSFGTLPAGTTPTPMNLWRMKNGNLMVVLVTSSAVAEVDTKRWKATRSFPTGPIPDGMTVAER